MKLIKKTLEYFLLLSLLFLIVPVQADPIQNRNIKWESNSCWISVGIQALTACTEFIEAYKNMPFAPNTPEQHLKDILIEIVDNEVVMHNGRLQSKKKLLDIGQFYNALAQKGVIQHGSGGGLFVPQFLRYLKTYVNPELAYYFFGIIFNNEKNYIFNRTNIQEHDISAEFECNYKEPAIFSFGKYCMLSIDVSKDNFVMSRKNNSKNIIMVIQNQLKKIATLSLIAKALDGYSSSSIPRGPHTFAMARKDESDDAWFLYDDLNKLVKKVDYDVPQENDGYAARYFEYKNGSDIYKTDLVYFKVDAPQPANSQSMFDCIRNNEFNKIDNPAIKASLNTHEATTSFSALHLACIKANRKLIAKLVEMGADINAKTGLGDTPLHIAAMTCSGNTIQYLISKGAQVNAINRLGRSPLYTAIRNVNPFAINVLINAGADINLHLDEIKDQESAQPLFNYFLNKINTQNVLAIAPLIEKISVSKKLTHVDKVKIQSFLDNNISPRWDHDAAEKVRIALNNILTGPSLPLPTAAEEDRLKEEARLEQERLERERLERERLEDEKRKKEEKNVLNKKLTQLKDSLTHLKTKLSTLQKQLKSLSKKITR